MEHSSLKNKYLTLIVGPSASGKSHLLEHIRQMGHQAVVSTTTRNSRPGEISGKDYNFIDEYSSRQYEAENLFVELITYNDVRYGVLETELFSKLEKGNGVAFLIVEPKGISIYKAYCAENNIIPITIFVDTPDIVRYNRLKADSIADPNMKTYTESGVNRIIRSCLHETNWKYLHAWDYTVYGEESPSDNYGRIHRDILEHLE